jgi:hypothetical protein
LGTSWAAVVSLLNLLALGIVMSSLISTLVRSSAVRDPLYQQGVIAVPSPPPLQDAGWSCPCAGASLAPLNIAVTNKDAAMDDHDELQDDAPSPGESTDDEADYRERAAAKLDQIARDAKEAMAYQGIDTPLFFLVPNSGDAILTFGTTLDPDDDEWNRIGEIVSNIVRHTVGLDRVRCQPVVCATSHDHQPLQSSVQSAGLSGCRSLPSSALQPSGATR